MSTPFDVLSSRRSKREDLSKGSELTHAAIASKQSRRLSAVVVDPAAQITTPGRMKERAGME